MLFKTLDTLRTKPKAIRDQYAFVFAGLFTVLIAGVWMLSLPSRLARITAGERATTSAPFTGLFTEFKAQFSKPSVPTTTPDVLPGTSVASTTEAALNLDLSTTTKAAVDASGVTIRFASTTIQSGPSRPVHIATTTATTTPN